MLEFIFRSRLPYRFQCRHQIRYRRRAISQPNWYMELYGYGKYFL